MAKNASIVTRITYPSVKCKELPTFTQGLKQMVNNNINSNSLPCFKSGNCFIRVTADGCGDGSAISSRIATEVLVEIAAFPSGSSLYSNGTFLMAYSKKF